MAIDTTYHSTMSEKMENLLVMSRRKDPARKTTRQHAFLMGLLLTDRGALEEIIHLLQRREPVYRETADLEISTEGKSPETIVAEILAGLGLQPPVDQPR